MELKNKIAIVTGAGRGIGKQVALDLAKEGCNLLICSRNAAELEEVKIETEKNGVVCNCFAADLSTLDNVNQLIEKAVELYGGIDILINNAGVLYKDGVLKVTEDQWDFTMDVNLKASFFLAQKAMKLMIENQSGYIINMASTAALCVPSGITSYGISKIGMIGASAALYEEGKKHNVKVSLIHPGMTDTGMLRSAGTGTTPDQWMLPEDISSCVVFLLKNSKRMVIKEIVPWATGYDQI